MKQHIYRKSYRSQKEEQREREQFNNTDTYEMKNHVGMIVLYFPEVVFESSHC